MEGCTMSIFGMQLSVFHAIVFFSTVVLFPAMIISWIIIERDKYGCFACREHPTEKLWGKKVLTILTPVVVFLFFYTIQIFLEHG